MKFILRVFVFTLVCLVFTSFRSGHDFQLDWKRISDKDYIVKYTTVVYDTTQTKGAGTRAHAVTVNEYSKTLSKKQVRQLQAFISDKANFEEAVEPDCDTPGFTHAFVVLRANDIAGIIELSCGGNYWLFEPETTGKASLRIIETGANFKDKLLKELNE